MYRNFSVEIGADLTRLEAGTRRSAQLFGDIANQAVQAGGRIAGGFDRAGASATRFSGQAISLRGELLKMAAQAFTVDKVLEFGNAILTTSGKFEKYNAILKNGLGSQAGARANLNMLTNFAAETPNQLDELTGSFIKFVNRGLIPSKAQLTNFGDLAASQGKGFDQLTEAILDAQTGEFERLKEFGIRASKSGDQVRLAFKGMNQTVDITTEGVTKAIEKFGQMSGVAGSMSAVAQTQEGMVSNLSDSYDRLLVVLGNAGVASAFKVAVGAASSFLSVVTDLIAASPAEELRKEQTEINGLVGAIALANDNETVRLNLITQLNQKYPEFLGQINAESVDSDLLARRLAAVNDQYERKIRLAVSQERLTSKQEEYTQTIRAQAQVYEQLAKAAGMSTAELSRLTEAQKIALARELGAKQGKVHIGQGVYVDNGMTAAANFLETSGEKLKKQKAELDALNDEGAAQQAELTRLTVEGYQKEIAAIREKIKAKAMDKTVGEAEIKRLQDQIRIAEGKPLKTEKPPVTDTKTKPKLKVDDSVEAFLRRTEAELEKKIQGLSQKEAAAQMQGLENNDENSLYVKLRAVRGELETLQGMTNVTPRLNITGIKEITGKGTQEAVDNILRNFLELADTTPELFSKTGINSFITGIERISPGLDYYRAKIEEIKLTIATMSLAKLALPPGLLADLKKLKELLAQAEGAAGAADAQTNPGASGEDDAKWMAKAQRRIDQMKAQGKQVKQTAEEMASDMKAAHDALAGEAARMLEGIGEGLGRGENPLKIALQSVMNLLGDFMIRIGTAMIVGGTLLTAAIAAFPFMAAVLKLDGPAGIIAGGALIVGGGAVKGLAGSLEGGGLATGRAIVEVGESQKALSGGGEFIAPVGLGARLIAQEMNKMGAFGSLRGAQPLTQLTPFSGPNGGMYIEVGGKMRLEGNDLVGSLRRTQNSNRVYGIGE
ncbi:hypothetical protein IC229_18440 [Spirosoma sp. BT702]|uniref:Tail tape measure protein n=1 Tax=Spirosoma profusum TaxID=2771354 RepID=A0A926Y1Y9_9BACT|nr:hypothetical protein [Spirosoma profusum]MBD2702632.1 hypothetical protein [Spirosoma profusum]